jgi:hypothetical protein
MIEHNPVIIDHNGNMLDHNGIMLDHNAVTIEHNPTRLDRQRRCGGQSRASRCLDLDTSRRAPYFPGWLFVHTEVPLERL